MEKSIIINNNNRYFEIFFGGSDLYFGMVNYNNENDIDNEFIIDKNNILYSYLKKLFNEYKKYDNKYDVKFNENVFEWYSEAYGIKEEQNKMIITKNDDNFIIKFIQNKKNMFNLKDTCFISFCLSGSSNQMIANYFSMMLNELLYNKSTKRKVKIKRID